MFSPIVGELLKEILIVIISGVFLKRRFTRIHSGKKGESAFTASPSKGDNLVLIVSGLAFMASTVAAIWDVSQIFHLFF